MKNYILAVATLMGAIIGVGMFTIPYVINKAGVIPLLIYIVVLGLIQYYLHMLFAEVVLSTKEKHRLPGFAGKYLNQKTKIVTFFIDIVGSYGSILAYIIVGGSFLYQLLSPSFGGNAFYYSTGLFLFVSAIVFFDIKMLAGTELVLTTFLVFAIGLITWRGFGHIQIDNYQLVGWKDIFLPYGPIFFAVNGGTAIPEICRLLDGQKQKIKSAIAWGTFLPVVITFIFVLVILGITGAKTSPDTLTGLSMVLNDGVITFSLIFGLLAILTSYVVVAQATEEIYQWDMKLGNKLSWFLAGFIPYFMFFFGWDDLIKIIGVTGAVSGGISGMILIWLALKVKIAPEKVSVIKNKLNRPLAWSLSLLFVFGLVYEVFNLFK